MYEKNNLRLLPLIFLVCCSIYKNGDDVSPAVKLGARRSELDNWEHILLRAGEKLDQSGYVKRFVIVTPHATFNWYCNDMDLLMRKAVELCS